MVQCIFEEAKCVTEIINRILMTTDVKKLEWEEKNHCKINIELSKYFLFPSGLS